MKNKNYEYLITMSLARNLLKQAIITEEEYRGFNEKTTKKYKVKNGDLPIDINLI